jgi:hypothetical protein
LAGIWCDILSYADRRESLFGTLTDRLLDRHPEDRIPHPGFVGSQYTTGGLLFLGMNPGAGGDGRTRDELPHYERLRQLQTAAPQDRVRAFERLMEYDAGWYPAIRIMRTIVTPIVNGAGLTYESIAYLNVLKWRTAKSSGLTQLYRISLKAHTLAQLAELDPGTIAVLGVGVTDCLAALPGFQEKYGQRCITVPRMRGDYSLPPEGIAAVNRIVAKLRSESQPK